MQDYEVAVTFIYFEGDSTHLFNFIISAVTRNDAWLNAVSKVYTLFSGSSATIRSIGLAVYTPPTNDGD